MTPDYTPEPGHQVVIRRYEVPAPELPGLAERKLLVEYSGTVASVRPLADGVLLRLEGLEDPIFCGDQFSGQGAGHGCSWTLRTVVIPAGRVTAYDLAGLIAQVALREREKAAALAAWERLHDAETIARQRLTGAQERLTAAQHAAAQYRADLAAREPGRELTERRAADRALMAGQVAQLAVRHGLGAGIKVHAPGTRETSVDITGPRTLGLTVRFRGNSPQCEPDTHLLSWHMRPWADEGRDWQLSPVVFGTGSVSAGGDKATEVANGFAELVQLLSARFAVIADGSAFVPAS